MAKDHEGKEYFVDKVYITKDFITDILMRWTDHEKLLEYIWDFARKGIVELDVRKEDNQEIMKIRFTGVNK
ncbi:hypothetical protein LCGC14_0643060 [marine sediment metagenome]|uniref:Uncharacterized protein n=1 Tax=marine sediment metagenome TaxID=412755 RepID=A0A0F9TK76_9ZZZZ|nr:hypothetical protein [Candidatus Aminicenantes bacterium]